MGQLLLVLAGALTVAAVVFGVAVLMTGGDSGLAPAEPDGRAVPLPTNRPLREEDVAHVRFDTALRGYRMSQVDQAMTRAAYDIGYKDELIGVLEAEVTALREGRIADADTLRDARETAASARTTGIGTEAAADRPATGIGTEAAADRPATDALPTVPTGDLAGPRPSVTGAGTDGEPEVETRDMAAADPFARPTADMRGTPLWTDRA
ncbi:DivIVA domain-containing protein [Plantactinospora sp. GCM10030261]|uniref:DivIVA domain-containing protein n=1 Tax=Plantactinospora sp. GCM10030261 TaxID=3273420 RepID=UPI003619BE69